MNGHFRWRRIAAMATATLAIAAFGAAEPAQAEKNPAAAATAVSGCQEALAAGQRTLTWRDPQSSKLDRPKIDFAGAQEQFRQALKLARTDTEKAAALLAVGESRLNDCRETNWAAIRADFARVLALPGAAARPKAQAAIGIGETYVRAAEYDRAREQFAKAREISADPGILIQAQYALAYSYLQQRRPDDARRELSRLLDMPGVNEPLNWRVRALLEGLEQVPRIRPGHPRLFFNEDTWPEVKARALGAQKAEFDQMKIRVNRLPDNNLGAKDWGSEAMEAAFVYRVTGDPAALIKVRKMMRLSVDFYLGRTVTRGRMYSLVGCAAALDWVWNDLAARERDELARDMINFVHTMDVEDRIQGGGILGPGNYYVRGVPWYFGLAAFSERLDDVAYGRAFTALGRGFLQCRGFWERAIKRGSDDGAIGTPLEYLFEETPTTLWQFLYCWESAMGNQVPPELFYYLSPDFILRNVLTFHPRVTRNGEVVPGSGLFVHFGYGNSWRKANGTRAELLYDHLAQIMHFFSRSHPQEAALARQLRERMGQAGLGGGGEYAIYPFLRDLDQAPPAAIPPNMPIARHFEHVGQILMSSGFGPQDTYALFSCGGNEDYGNLDATHFTIYKQGYLALDSGTRALTHAGAPGINYNHQTVAHNCVLIYMEGEAFPHNAVNSGGQCRDPSAAKLIAFESCGKDYAYAATDATPAYHEGKCARMVRQFIYLPPDYFLVFDRVTTQRAEYPKTWLLHTANEPLIAGREFRADQGQGRLFCRTIYPADAVPSKIGGPGKEFWAGGCNWPIPANSPYLHSIGTDRADKVPESIGRWRVEVKPAAARTDDCFLHLIQVSGQAVEQMVANQVNETGSQIQITFGAGPRTYTVTLNKTGEVGGHMRVAEGGQVLVDRPLTQAIMPQAGLALQK